MVWKNISGNNPNKYVSYTSIYRGGTLQEARLGDDNDKGTSVVSHRRYISVYY
jgi:hypothetical protein